FQSAADMRFALETVADARGASAAQEPAPQRAPWARATPLRIAIAAATILGIGGGVWYARTPRQPATAAIPPARGLAVLPFDNLGEAGQAYFAAGVTE